VDLKDYKDPMDQLEQLDRKAPTDNRDSRVHRDGLALKGLVD
jgi:hypothetical protein